MHWILRAVAVAVVSVTISNVALAATATNQPILPQGYKLPRDLKLPVTASVAIYLPSAVTEEATFVSEANVWLRPGKATGNGVLSVAKSYLTDAFLVQAGSEKPWGLLITVRPKRNFERGDIRQVFKYKVFDSQSKLLLEGEQIGAAPAGDLVSGTGYTRAAMKATQLMLLDVITKLRPDSAGFTTTGIFRNIKPDLFVDRDNAIASGTGFYINAAGQIVTAAHVVHDCVLTEAAREDQKFDTRLVAASNLLDIAVMDTGAPAPRVLPLRVNAELNLGEPVANVGFPLQKILAASPNLTRGNVSSRGALAGSVGQFQFSAPVQPGSSGGPVVSDGGELLGVTVGTLNALAMVEKGILPQNVNFALDAKYAAMFLRKNQIAFTELPPNTKGDMKTGNEAALGAVVRLTCYQ